MLNIGEAIEFYRKEKGITLSRLAELTGLTQGYLSQIKNGKRTPTDKALEQIANSLGVSPMDILDKAETFSDIQAKPHELKLKLERIKSNNDFVVALSDKIVVAVNVHVHDLLKSRQLKMNEVEAVVESALQNLIDKYREEFYEQIHNNLLHLIKRIENEFPR